MSKPKGWTKHSQEHAIAASGRKVYTGNRKVFKNNSRMSGPGKQEPDWVTNDDSEQLQDYFEKEESDFKNGVKEWNWDQMKIEMESMKGNEDFDGNKVLNMGSEESNYPSIEEGAQDAANEWNMNDEFLSIVNNEAMKHGMFAFVEEGDLWIGRYPEGSNSTKTKPWREHKENREKKKVSTNNSTKFKHNFRNGDKDIQIDDKYGNELYVYKEKNVGAKVLVREKGESESSFVVLDENDQKSVRRVLGKSPIKKV
jgi:hypothetical protein